MLPWQLIELAWTCTWFDCSQIIHQLYHDFSCVSPHVCRILLPVASPPPWKALPTRDPAAHLRLLCHPALETVGVGGRRQAKNNKHTKWYPSHIIRNMIYNIYIYIFTISYKMYKYIYIYIISYLIYNMWYTNVHTYVIFFSGLFIKQKHQRHQRSRPLGASSCAWHEVRSGHSEGCWARGVRVFDGEISDQ